MTFNANQLEELKIFGIETDKLSAEEVNEEIIKKLHLLTNTLKLSEFERFKEGIKKLQQPTN